METSGNKHLQILIVQRNEYTHYWHNTIGRGDNQFTIFSNLHFFPTDVSWDDFCMSLWLKYTQRSSMKPESTEHRMTDKNHWILNNWNKNLTDSYQTQSHLTSSTTLKWFRSLGPFIFRTVTFNNTGHKHKIDVNLQSTSEIVLVKKMG